MKEARVASSYASADPTLHRDDLFRRHRFTELPLKSPSWYPSFGFEEPGFSETAGLSPEAVARARYMADNRAAYSQKLSMLFQLMELKPGSALLSVGAGTGLDLCEWARAGVRACALEIHPSACTSIERASGFYEATYRSPPIQAVSDSAEHLGFDSGAFDAVFTENAFEHFAFPLLALAEQRRVLKPGGKLLIIDGNLLQVLRLYSQIFKEPKLSKGRAGGLRWAFQKSRTRKVYGNYLCRDEDWHTPGWWHQRLCDAGFHQIHTGTTSHIFHPTRPSWLHPFCGPCLILGTKPHSDPQPMNA